MKEYVNVKQLYDYQKKTNPPNAKLLMRGEKKT